MSLDNEQFIVEMQRIVGQYNPATHGDIASYLSGLSQDSFMARVLSEAVTELQNTMRSSHPSRRDFLKYLGLGTGAMLFGASRIAAASEEVSTETEPHETDPGYLSKMNVLTSAAVASAFSSMVGSQALLSGKDEQSSPRLIKKISEISLGKTPEMGLHSALLMSSLWSGRILLLKFDAATHNKPDGTPDWDERHGSQHAVDHEVHELLSPPIGSLYVAGALVAASEVTAHIKYGEPLNPERAKEYVKEITQDGKITFGNVTLTEQELIDYIALADAHTVEKLGELKGEELTQELLGIINDALVSLQIEKKLDHLKQINGKDVSEVAKDLDDARKDLAETILKSGYLSMVTAPLSLTYTSASIANHFGREIAEKFLVVRTMERVLSANENNQEVNLDIFIEEAKQQVIQKDMNGPFGYVNLALATAANINGAAIFGDPPNFFFLLKYGLKEWLLNSAVGFALSVANTASLYNAYTISHVGQTGFEINWKSFKHSFYTVGKTWGNITSSVHNAIREKMPDALKQRMGRMIPNSVNKPGGYLSIDWEELLENKQEIFTDLLWGNEIDLRQRLNSLRKRFLGTLGKVERDALAQVLENTTEISTGNLEDQIRKIIEEAGAKLGVEKPLVDASLKSVANYVEELMKYIDSASDDSEAGEAAIHRFFDDFGITNNEVKELIIAEFHSHFANAKTQNKKEGHEHDGHHGKASHAAKDVRNALFTQLFAVGALQVLTKKLLKLDDQNMKLTIEQAETLSTAILGVVAVTSAVADNVAAMIFGIDVLETIGKKAAGEKNYEEYKYLAEALRRWAFIMSVAAGALTKIGNGANMSIEKLSKIIRNDDKDVLEVLMRPNTLGESIPNPYPYIIVLEVLALGHSEFRHAFSGIPKAA